MDVSFASQSGNAPTKPKAKFKHKARIQSSYDRSKNETVVVLDEMQSLPVAPGIHTEDATDLTMTVSFSYPGTST